MNLNWSAVAVLAGAAMVSAAVAVPEYERSTEIQQLQALCSRPETQERAKKLARESMLPAMRRRLDRQGSAWTQSDVDRATKFDLGEFHVAKIDRDAMHVTCGAALTLTVAGAQGRQMRSTGSVLQFEIFQADGQRSEMTMAGGIAFESAFDSLVEVKPAS